MTEQVGSPGAPLAPGAGQDRGSSPRLPPAADGVAPGRQQSAPAAGELARGGASEDAQTPAARLGEAEYAGAFAVGPEPGWSPVRRIGEAPGPRLRPARSSFRAGRPRAPLSIPPELMALVGRVVAGECGSCGYPTDSPAHRVHCRWRRKAGTQLTLINCE